MKQFLGNPCWYELGTSDPDAAAAFYGELLHWQVSRAGMADFDYHLARRGDCMVAGVMSLDAQPAGVPPNWLIYFATDDIEHLVAEVTAAGGAIHHPPADIPGTGRFAIAADPQGAVFGLLQPDMSAMSLGEIARAEKTGAFDQDKAGHGNWNELMTPDPEAGLAFYARLFGWDKGAAMDMGEMGRYQLIRRNGRDIGAIMAQGDAPVPCWMPYFGVDDPMTETVERVRQTGGHVHHGPVEVPGPAWIAIIQDPQGAWLGLVSGEK
ncbi:MAG: VOC family protein [Paracoccus sp. (in: a-proteobacteria)]|nr:VOC family protein [Paracoccus sp. (in: a-proteobacteria)]